MRVGRTVKWGLAVSAWLVAVIGSAIPAIASPALGVGEFSLSWAQLAMLIGIGAAWGDMRAQMRSLKDRVDKIEPHVHKKGDKR